VNAGLTCGGGVPMPSIDPICHNAAVKRVGNALVPQYGSCNLRSGWEVCPGTGKYAKSGDCSDSNAEKFNAKTAHEQKNAFGCGSGTVVPDAGCSAPSPNSKDCPLEVTGIPCVTDNFGPMAGHCGLGYEHARCSQDSDCVFTAQQWWGAYDDGKPKPFASFVGVEQPQVPWKDGKSVDIIGTTVYPSDGGAGVGRFLPTETFSRKPPGGSYDGFTRAFAAPIRWGSFIELAANDARLVRWPSPHPVLTAQPADVNQLNVAPGLCEGAVGARMDPAGYIPTMPGPFVYIANSHIFDSFKAEQFALHVGRCDGGVNAGAFCFSSSTASSASWPHPNTCAPVGYNPNTNFVNLCQSVASQQADGSWLPTNVACQLLGHPNEGDPFSDDPALDNNACTRPAGYVPWKQVCGNDPSNEKCLLGYDLSPFFKQSSLNQTSSTTPTDVTSGLHTPIFLGLNNANPDDYRHIAHYAPRPPTIAAPDLSRECASPGSCPVSLMNRFTIEQQSEGVVAFGGGQGQVSMRFYGWAAHDQSPLTELNIDWGDGTITKISDARMKNKKPFCGTTRECSNVQGLTCQSDADCPPAGGACVDVGTCAQNPSLRCTSNAQCELAGTVGDRCITRQFFGNSAEACEQNFFEFTHAYACDPVVLPTCDGLLRCSRNPNIVCSGPQAQPCGVGDQCVPGLAPSSIDGVTGGCFDQVNNACRFTPKLMLKDGFNWCTGECRAGPLVGNNPTDAPFSSVIHVNGGCWDGTETVKNTNFLAVMNETANPANISNECTLNPSKDLNPNIRPWIVYPGAIQIGVFK